MSYCRWSSDFGECDVYVYEDVSGGWTTHVAGRRLKQLVPDVIRNMPIVDANGDFDVDAWMNQHKAECEWRDSLPCDEIVGNVMRDGMTRKEPIKFPKDSEYIDLSDISDLAGESYNDQTPGECANRLKMIRETGLNVPQYAIDELCDEQRESVPVTGQDDA